MVLTNEVGAAVNANSALAVVSVATAQVAAKATEVVEAIIKAAIKIAFCVFFIVYKKRLENKNKFVLRRQFNKIIKKYKWFFNIFLTILNNMITKPKNELDTNVKMLSKTAFTLIEILVVISMIMILVIWLSRIDLSKGQDVQQSLSFSQKLQIPIEKTITNALIWKWIWTSLMVPSAWKIDISKANSWTLITSYTWGSRIQYETITAEKLSEISNIRCYDLNNNLTQTMNITETWTIYITWCQIWTNCIWSWKIMEIETKYKKLFPHKIRINSVSGIVEKD